jgi:hypothetical protein
MSDTESEDDVIVVRYSVNEDNYTVNIIVENFTVPDSVVSVIDIRETEQIDEAIFHISQFSVDTVGRAEILAFLRANRK